MFINYFLYYYDCSGYYYCTNKSNATIIPWLSLTCGGSLHATATRKVEEIGIDLGKEALWGTPLPLNKSRHVNYDNAWISREPQSETNSKNQQRPVDYNQLRIFNLACFWNIQSRCLGSIWIPYPQWLERWMNAKAFLCLNLSSIAKSFETWGLTLISTPLVRVSVAVQISVQAEKYSCIAAASAQVFVWCSLTRLSCFAEA